MEHFIYFKAERQQEKIEELDTQLKEAMSKIEVTTCRMFLDMFECETKL